jgi:hypothetical protein
MSLSFEASMAEAFDQEACILGGGNHSCDEDWCFGSFVYP